MDDENDDKSTNTEEQQKEGIPERDLSSTKKANLN